MDLAINPVMKVQRVTVDLPNQAAHTSEPAKSPKIFENDVKRPGCDVFITNQEVKKESPKTFGDKFLLAAKETVQEFKDKGLPLSKVNSEKMSSGIIERMIGYDSVRSKKIDYVG